MPLLVALRKNWPFNLPLTYFKSTDMANVGTFMTSVGRVCMSLSFYKVYLNGLNYAKVTKLKSIEVSFADLKYRQKFTSNCFPQTISTKSSQFKLSNTMLSKLFQNS